MSKLNQVEVYTTTKVIMERQLQCGDEIVTGEADEGDLDVLESDTCIQIFIKISDLHSGNIPYSALAYHLSEALEITGERKRFIMDILVTQNQNRLEGILEQNGFHSELQEDQSTDTDSKASDGYSMGDDESKIACMSTHKSDAEQNFSTPAGTLICSLYPPLNPYKDTSPSSVVPADSDHMKQTNASLTNTNRRRAVIDSSFCIKQAQISVDKPDIMAHSMMDTALTGRDSRHSPATNSRQDEHRERIWSTDEMRSALPLQDSRKETSSNFSNQHLQPDALSKDSRKVVSIRSGIPRNESHWEEDQEIGYLGELYVSLGVLSWHSRG